MIIGITVICCMLLFSILVAIVYFSKSKIKNVENKLYSRLLIITFLGLIIELLCFYFVYNKDLSNIYNLINEIINRIFLIYLLLWEFSFTEYIFFVSFENRIKFKDKLKRNKKNIIFILLIIYVAMCIIIVKLPLNYFNDGKYIYSYGPATNVLLLMGGIFIIIDITSVLFNIKHASSKKYYPLFMLIVMMIFVFIIRQINPGITIINSAFAFVTIFMYFTIENPDLKVVNELLRNKELVEKEMEGKSRFLFEMSQDVKEPAKNILSVVKNYDKLENDVDKKQAIRIIENNANDLLFKINDVLDISSMDASKIKISEEEYNPITLFNNVKSIVQNKIGTKDISLSFNVSNSVPDKLYADEVRFKQILSSILFNSVENTKSGFINVNVDAIVRYDVARLIIKIEDSGTGMSLDEINNILDDRTELTNNDEKKLDKLDVDLKATIKIIKLLGGSLNIKSTLNKGSLFTIILDQKCEEEKPSEIMKNVQHYSSDVFGKKRVLVVDDDKEELFRISDLLGKYNLDINTTMMGKECVDKINAGEFYNLIIIDDELRTTSAFSIFKELKENKKFKTDVIVMIEKDKEHFKKHYVEDGFKDIINKDNLTEEVKRVVDKYL